MTETKEFMQYVKISRHNFSVKINDLFYSSKSNYRVIIEDLLICFDQMVERLQNIYSADSLFSSILSKVSDKEIEEIFPKRKNDSGRDLSIKSGCINGFKTAREIMLPLITQQAVTIQQQQEEIERLKNKISEHILANQTPPF